VPARPRRAGGATGGERLGRNLEVVPYAGDTTPGVNLSVQFATASDRLTPADRAMLDTLAAALKTPNSVPTGLPWPATPTPPATPASTWNCPARAHLPCAAIWATWAWRHSVSRPTVLEARAWPMTVTRPPAANRRVEIRRAPAP
jgi:hypothetical protein